MIPTTGGKGAERQIGIITLSDFVVGEDVECGVVGANLVQESHHLSTEPYGLGMWLGQRGCGQLRGVAYHSVAPVEFPS